ncbi:MAG: ATP-binding protein [Actinomycetota bacterium]|nr:ATP-binding protein [Actinomycetota bacterium]
MSTSRTTAQIRGLQYAAALLMSVISLVSLVGWLAGNLDLAGRVVRYDPMVPVTALVFLALCIALVVRLRFERPRARRLIWGTALSIWLVVVAEIVDFLAGIPISPDRLFVTAADMVQGRQMGRMSPVVALLFAALATALVLYESIDLRKRSIAVSVSMVVAVVGFTLCVGYAYDAPLLYSLSPFTPSVFASIGMFVMGLGIAALGLEQRPFALFLGDSVQAQLMRAAMPATVFAALAFAALGVVDLRFGLAVGPIPTSLAVILVILVVTVVILQSASRIGARLDAVEADRQVAEDALRESEWSYRNQFAGNAVVMLLVGPVNGRILDANAAAASFYGYPREIMMEMSTADLSTDPIDAVSTTMAGDKERGGGRFEFRHRLADGAERDVDVSSSVVQLGGREVIHSIILDITERKHIEAELAAQHQTLEALVEYRTTELLTANEELREATAAKSDFLASMSHELRTPLNSIIGFSDIMRRGMAGELTEEQRKQIGMIHESGLHLLTLINAVLDLSKVEAGRVELRIEALDVAALVREAAEIVRPMAASKALGLCIDVDGGDWTLESDGYKVRQILLNLISNAVKFTEAGEVVVAVERAPDRALCIAVSDTGYGISETNLSRIFEAFTQIDTPDIIMPPGTGLGLSISREFAHLLGGEIKVRSELGVGSTFTLTLPAIAPVAPVVESKESLA